MFWPQTIRFGIENFCFVYESNCSHTASSALKLVGAQRCPPAAGPNSDRYPVTFTFEPFFREPRVADCCLVLPHFPGSRDTPPQRRRGKGGRR